MSLTSNRTLEVTKVTVCFASSSLKHGQDIKAIYLFFFFQKVEHDERLKLDKHPKHFKYTQCSSLNFYLY